MYDTDEGDRLKGLLTFICLAEDELTARSRNGSVVANRNTFMFILPGLAIY